MGGPGGLGGELRGRDSVEESSRSSSENGGNNNGMIIRVLPCGHQICLGCLRSYLASFVGKKEPHRPSTGGEEDLARELRDLEASLLRQIRMRVSQSEEGEEADVRSWAIPCP